MLENSDDFSDELDEFEESRDDTNVKKKVRTSTTAMSVIAGFEWSCRLNTKIAYRRM
jgi:hypothetical protein